MTNLIDFFARHGLAVAVGVIPSAVSLILVIYTESWRRWLAIALVLFTGFVFAFELYSGSLEGNLTGLIWMLTTPLAAIAIVIVSIVEWSVRRRKHSSDTSFDKNQRK